MPKTLPKFLEPYFWDVKFGDLNFQKYPKFVVERILEYGNKEGLKWLINNISRNFIKETVKKSVQLSPKSIIFWSLIFDFNKKELLCLKKSLQKNRGNLWRF